MVFNMFVGLGKSSSKKANSPRNRAAMKLWVLIIFMIRGQTEYGYKFVEKKNCDKIGKEIVKTLKRGTYKCKLKNF